VAYAVHTLKNCHEYNSVDEIIGLDQHFTKWSWVNASENFHIQLHKCIFKVIKPPIIWVPTYNHMKLHMTFSFAMHVIPKPCHIKSKLIYIYIYIWNNFWALDLCTQTYAKGTLVNLHNHRKRVAILFAKEYESVYTAEPQTTKNSWLLHLNLHTYIRTVYAHLYYK